MASLWRLPAEIIALSRAKIWEEAVREWELDFIEKLDPGEGSESCLCGHSPITELCHIINTKTDSSAIVGSHCIQKFEKDDPAHAVFGNGPKIFRSVNKLLKDNEATASKALLKYASQKGVLTKTQIRSYKKDKGKRKLSVASVKNRIKCNNILIFGIAIKTEKAAFKRLLEDETFETTAGPKLIECGFNKKVLTIKNYDFYKNIWNRAHSSLSVKQKQYKVDLNKKIVFQLKDDFIDDIESQRSSSSSSSLNRSSSSSIGFDKEQVESDDDLDEDIETSSALEENVTFRSKRKRNAIEIESEDESSEL